MIGRGTVRAVQIDVFVPIGAANASPGFLRRLGPAIEERGFGAVWVPEHVVLFDDYDSEYPYDPSGKFPGAGDSGLLEPLTALTYLAAVTDRIRLGTAICLVPQRNPVYTAKQVADLDVLSNGRVDFGIGVGWLREEFEALNVPFDQRGRRTNEYLSVMRSLWIDETSSYDGDLFQLPPTRCYPKPVQSPVPVHVGGESSAAMRRAAKYGQGWFSFNRGPDEFDEVVPALDAALADVGRARTDDDFTFTVCPYLRSLPASDLEAYAAHGVDRLIAMGMIFTEDTIESTLDDLVRTVLEPAAALG